MNFDQHTEEVTNLVRKYLQKWTDTIDEGESISIALWYSFILDHAKTMNLDPNQLAREQLEEFLKEMPVEMTREH